jgi:hypothetical protein
MATTLRRRQFLRTAGGLVLATAGGLVLPGRAQAAGCPYGCGAVFGPLHRYLWATGVSPQWQHAIITRESSWNPAATNPSSGAAGLAQFLPWVWWDWLVPAGLASGSPYNGYQAIDAMTNCLEAGYAWMWDCGPADC